MSRGYYVITSTIKNDVLFLKDLVDAIETYDLKMSYDLREAVVFDELETCVKLLDLLEDDSLSVYSIELKKAEL